MPLSPRIVLMFWWPFLSLLPSPSEALHSGRKFGLGVQVGSEGSLDLSCHRSWFLGSGESLISTSCFKLPYLLANRCTHFSFLKLNFDSREKPWHDAILRLHRPVFKYIISVRRKRTDDRKYYVYFHTPVKLKVKGLKVLTNTKFWKTRIKN